MLWGHLYSTECRVQYAHYCMPALKNSTDHYRRTTSRGPPPCNSLLVPLIHAAVWNEFFCTSWEDFTLYIEKVYWTTPPQNPTYRKMLLLYVLFATLVSFFKFCIDRCAQSLPILFFTFLHLPYYSWPISKKLSIRSIMQQCKYFAIHIYLCNDTHEL